jgi:proteasome lid subunit RPN8/RPN11
LESTADELRSRSANWRESAATWCGRIVGSEWRASAVRFHHRLCDDRGRPLSISLTEDAKFGLYEEMNGLGLTLIAGVHTHPEDWVGLSWIDQRNQLSSRDGFWSVVVPWYARGPWNVSEMGFHVRTSAGWCRLTADQVLRHIHVEG